MRFWGRLSFGIGIAIAAGQFANPGSNAWISLLAGGLIGFGASFGWDDE